MCQYGFTGLVRLLPCFLRLPFSKTSTSSNDNDDYNKNNARDLASII